MNPLPIAVVCGGGGGGEGVSREGSWIWKQVYEQRGGNALALCICCWHRDTLRSPPSLVSGYPENRRKH